MKTKAIRFKDCKHCKKEFMYSRTDQNFCCVSCRSANFSMRRRAGTVKQLRGLNKPTDPNIDFPNLKNDDLSGKDLLKLAGISFIAPVTIEITKAFMGINDKSQMAVLKKIHDDQIVMNNNIVSLYKLIAEQLKLKKSPETDMMFYLGN